jgi:hypothetical protein
MYNFLSDNPVTEPEHDTFDFNQNYVDMLEDVILNTQHLPFTIGIFGEWGSGKTSLMKLIYNRFKDREKQNIEEYKRLKDRDEQNIENGIVGDRAVWFNPWKYDKKEELWTSLIKTILLELQNENPSGEAKRRAIELLKDIAWIAIKGAVPVVSGGIISTRKLEKMKDHYTKVSNEITDLYNKFEDNFSFVVKKTVGQNKRVVIFIDDLDRCMPQNAITILESLKLYMDNSQCVFVLGMDRKIVELGIKERYGEKIKLSGREYLDKIIQLPFFLPPIQFGTLQDTLESEANDAGITPKIWTLLRYGLGGNPRKVKRFFNSYYMAQKALQRLPSEGTIIIKDSADGKTGEDKNNKKKEENIKEIKQQNFYLAKILIIQMSYTNFYDYLLIDPSGWQTYENKLLNEKAQGRQRILKENLELANIWKDRRLRFFMDKTSGSKFFPAPSVHTLERILRFTGLVSEEGTVTDEAREEKRYVKNQYAKMK